MQDPVLKFQKYCSQTEKLIDVCQLRLQYFEPEQTFDIFDHEYVKRYDVHFYHKRGELNCRYHTNKILFGEHGYVYSFAKVYAQNVQHHPHDHLIASFSGYGDCTEYAVIMNLAQYSKNTNNQNKPVVDDYELLMKKYNEISKHKEMV
ncbi:hypothetical protein GAP32_400 [Cronobacter phage vB_CsaM_GAP32]|uniref:Uncharacterized protein n=1 Tax=Cronobacter phage vB_CsaM_GAP32 TaxID=1141136 RepID=K4F744_9CAUD|nr:hypothetical protein GAP32_400 [Cronobacter phage vB_CsaM_GAP32]AFC21853.1 hypothetical protein GAP32_400 [Cronobacter phage vB_CsaM_GAP32]